jgi:hypothetical protein
MDEPVNIEAEPEDALRVLLNTPPLGAKTGEPEEESEEA